MWLAISRKSKKKKIDNAGVFGWLCDACCTGYYTLQAEFASVHIVEFVGTAKRAVNTHILMTPIICLRKIRLNLEHFKPKYSDKYSHN